MKREKEAHDMYDTMRMNRLFWSMYDTIQDIEHRYCLVKGQATSINTSKTKGMVKEREKGGCK